MPKYKYEEHYVDTAEKLAGKNGLPKKLTRRFYSKALDAEMDKLLGYKKK